MDLTMTNRYDRQGECRRWCGGACCSIHGYQGTPEYEQIKAEFEKPPFFGLNEHGECKKLKYIHGIPTCSVYDDRPEICRTFPVHPRDITAMPECGYSFVKRPDPIIPKPPPNPFVAMAWTEEWPLFSLKKHLFPELKQVYIEVDEVPPMKTLAHLRCLMLELRRLEWKCWYGGIAGWLMAADPDNLTIQGAAVTWGAEYYATQSGYDWFRKPIPTAPKAPLLTLQELKTGIATYQRTLRGAYAHAID